MVNNYIFDENNNLILDNENDYIVGDIIVIDNKNEYEVVFVDNENNLAYAEFSGTYDNKNFSSKYYKNVISFSIIFVAFLVVVFSLSLFYKLKLKRKRRKTLKHH